MYTPSENSKFGFPSLPPKLAREALPSAEVTWSSLHENDLSTNIYMLEHPVPGTQSFISCIFIK